MPFKGLINKASNKIKSALENSDTFSKVVSAKKKLKLAGIIASFVGFLVAIIVFAAVLLYFLGIIQKAVEEFQEVVSDVADRGGNTLSGACLLCSTEELEKIKEDQFNTKIRLIGEALGDKVDTVVLASTILYGEMYYDVIDETYTADFDENEFLSALKSFWQSLGQTGNSNYDGIKQEKIDLIDAATLIMVNSNVNGKYDEESYKKALASPGYGGDSWVVNAAGCISNTAFQLSKEIWNFIPFASNSPFASGNLVDVGNAVVDSMKICQYGFIESTVDYVAGISDENQKTLKKQQVADDIIQFAEIYKMLFRNENDTCVYSGSASTGDYANWKQWGESWSDISLGGGGSLGKIGCTTTSSAMLIAKSGTLITNLPSGYSEFNPGAFATSLNAHGGYSSGGGMTWSGWNDIAPNFNSGYTVDTSIYSETDLARTIGNVLNTLEDGKYQRYVLLCFSWDNSSQHWVAVDNIENNVVKIMDPGLGATHLSEKYTNWHVFAYRVMWATDVTNGKSTANSTLDISNSSYKSRIDGLSEFYQGGDRLGNVPIGNTIYMVAGCLPSSLMAAYYMYTGETPDVTKFTDDIIKQGAWINGGGGVTSPYFDTLESSPIITQNWGLSLQPIKTDMNTVIQTLKSGKKILVNIRPKSGMYKNGSGHFMMLDHYDESSDKIYVFNPSGYSDGQGYQSKDTVQNEILNHLNNGLWEINSSKVSSLNSCGGDADDEGMLEFIAGVEGGDEAYCNYNGKGAKTGYGVTNLNDGAGLTTAFGVTTGGDTERAATVGYTTFTKDMQNGCVDKDYIYKIFAQGYYDNKETITSYLESQNVSGLTNAQIGVLASVLYGGGTSHEKIIEKIKKYGANSYEVFNCFVSIPCGFTNNTYKDGLANRRAAEYEVFITGNYKAVNPGKNYAYFAAIDSMSALKVYEKTWPTGK